MHASIIARLRGQLATRFKLLRPRSHFCGTRREARMRQVPTTTCGTIPIPIL